MENKISTFWYREKIILLVAGLMNILGILLAQYVHPLYWILSGAVSINLILYSLTGFCLLGTILFKLGIKSQNECSL